MSSPRRGRLLSTPTEHGALVILVAAGGLAVAVAPQPGIAAAVAAVFVVAFLARGPVERRVRRFRPRPWDLAAFFVYLAAAAAATYAIARTETMLAMYAAGCGVMLVGGGAIAQILRIHRTLAVELAGMGMGGLATGLAIIAGGGESDLAVIAAISLTSYAIASVLVVRSQLRKPGRRAALNQCRLAFCVLVVGAAFAATHAPILAAAFGPRAAYVAVRGFALARTKSPYVVAALETGQLLVFVALFALLGQ